MGGGYVRSVIQAVLETNTVRLFVLCFFGFIVGLIVARKERAQELAAREEGPQPTIRQTSDEAFARWVVGLAFDGKRPSSVVSLLVQAVHEARKARDAEMLLSVMRAVFGARYERVSDREAFIRRFVSGGSTLS